MFHVKHFAAEADRVGLKNKKAANVIDCFFVVDGIWEIR